MNQYLRLVLLLFFVSIFNKIAAQTPTITAESNGDWDNATTWDLSRIPGDNDIIAIPPGMNVTVNGTTHNLDDAILIIQGTLTMDKSCGLCFPSLTFNDTDGDGDSGLIIEAGGNVVDAVNAFVTGALAFININGEDVWTADGCIFGCGTVTGDFTPSEDVTFPQSLPIELLFFDVYVVENGIEVNWITSSEFNNDYFIIERSKNDIEWSEIGTEQGAGNSTKELSYLFLDSDPIVGMSYYRLKQIDFDGQHEYFEPVMVNNLEKESLEVKMYPNPINDRLFITINSGVEKFNYNVKDLEGKKLISGTIDYKKQSYINVNDLSTGTYLIECTSDNIQFIQRIFKK